jgi:hypothetical protein
LITKFSSKGSNDDNFAYIEESEVGVQLSQPVPVIVVGAAGSSGEPIAGSSSTAGPTLTEANSSNIYNEAAYIRAASYYGGNALFGARSLSATTASNAQPRLINCELTATGGGEISSANIVDNLSGYQTCALIYGLWSDQTDASISMSIDTASGVDVGPTTWAWATTANAVTDYKPGVYYRGSTDNEALACSCAAGQAQANQKIQVLGEYWYET